MDNKLKLFYWDDISGPLMQHTSGQVTVLATDKDAAIKLAVDTHRTNATIELEAAVTRRWRDTFYCCKLGQRTNLTNACEVCGKSREKILREERCAEMQRMTATLEREIAELRVELQTKEPQTYVNSPVAILQMGSC